MADTPEVTPPKKCFVESSALCELLGFWPLIDRFKNI